MVFYLIVEFYNQKWNKSENWYFHACGEHWLDTKTLATTSFSSSSSSTSSCSCSSSCPKNWLSFSNFCPAFDESCRISDFRQKPTWKNKTHLRQAGRQDLSLIFRAIWWQNRTFWSHLHLRFVGAPEWRVRLVDFEACLEEWRTRTWPMHVTFGEDGSWVY